MQLIAKLFITELIGAIIGLVICLVWAEEDNLAGVVGALLFLVSVLALLVTGLCWIWS